MAIISDISALYGDQLNPSRLKDSFDSRGNPDIVKILLDTVLHRNAPNQYYLSAFDQQVKKESGELVTVPGMVSKLTSDKDKVGDFISIIGHTKDTALSYEGPMFDLPNPIGGNADSANTIRANTDLIKMLDFTDTILADTGKSAAVILCNSPFVSPALNESIDASTFFNGIPNLHLSRCSPFLSVQFEYQRKVVANSSILTTPSILKFLLGAVPPSGEIDKAMFQNDQQRKFVPEKQKDQSIVNEEVIVFKSGMEIFTTPQTVVSTPTKDLNTPTSTRYVDFRDKFVPLASVETVTVTQKPSGFGEITYPSAKIEIKVHDRTRLGELSDMLRAEYLKSTVMTLTYGLQYSTHPGEADNVYAQFINKKANVTQVFDIVNMSYTFTEDNGVKITLEAMAHVAQLITKLQILDGSQASATLSTIMKIRAELAAVLDEYNKDQKGLPEVRKIDFVNEMKDGMFKELDTSQLSAMRGLLIAYASRTGVNLEETLAQLNELIKNVGQTPPKAETASPEPNAANDQSASDNRKFVSLQTELREYIKSKLWHRTVVNAVNGTLPDVPPGSIIHFDWQGNVIKADVAPQSKYAPTHPPQQPTNNAGESAYTPASPLKPA
jgi:hypothetical protein